MIRFDTFTITLLRQKSNKNNKIVKQKHTKTNQKDEKNKRKRAPHRERDRFELIEGCGRELLLYSNPISCCFLWEPHRHIPEEAKETGINKSGFGCNKKQLRGGQLGEARDQSLLSSLVVFCVSLRPSGVFPLVDLGFFKLW
jgi:hypothetical protein